MAFAQFGNLGFDGQIELEALRRYGLPEDALGILYGCPSLAAWTRTVAAETTWELPSREAASSMALLLDRLEPYVQPIRLRRRRADDTAARRVIMGYRGNTSTKFSRTPQSGPPSGASA